MFLSTVHPNATFQDLNLGQSILPSVSISRTDEYSAGRERLKESLEQRSGALKLLVQAEWDRFVSVKGATEGEPRLQSRAIPY